MQHEIIIAGLGGQGIVVSSLLLAHSALAEGKQVAHFSAYTGNMRGGRCECTVTIATDKIDSPPLLSSLSALIAMHRDALEQHQKALRPGGLLVLNTSIVGGGVKRNDVTLLEIPASELAEELGNIMAANMVILGGFAEETKVVSMESLVNGLREVVPPHRQRLMALNQRALTRGAQFMRQEASPRRPALLNLFA